MDEQILHLTMFVVKLYKIFIFIHLFTILVPCISAVIRVTQAANKLETYIIKSHLKNHQINKNTLK